MKQKSVTVSGAGSSGKDGPLHPLHSLLHPFSQSQSKLKTSGASKKGKELTPSSSFLLGNKGEKLNTIKYTTVGPGGRTLLFDNATAGNADKRGSKYDVSHVPTVRQGVGTELVSTDVHS